MDIGQNIKIARKRAQLTQKQLSELSNVAAVTIQQYETGKRQPQIEQLLKLADALHVTLEEILGIRQIVLKFLLPATCCKPWIGMQERTIVPSMKKLILP